MSDDQQRLEELLGPKCSAILEASRHLALFQTLVADHQMTGMDIAKGLQLINLNERTLSCGGAKT